METIFFSDLDRTLIFAGYKNKGHKCVDYRGGKEIAFMTDKAESLLLKLLEMKNFIFIPTTIRPLSHTMEISFIEKYKPKYIICTNGADIYIDGVLDKEWDFKMRSLVNKCELQSILNKIEKLNTSAYEIMNANDFYLKIKFKSKEEANKWVEEIRGLMHGDYYVLHQSKIVFVMNKNIRKEEAVKYLIKKENFKNIHTAGDSEPDEVFTSLDCVTSYLPKHSTFKHSNSFISEKEGIEATEEILEKIIKNIKLNRYLTY